MSGQVPYVSQSVGMTAADAQQVGTDQTVVASTTSLTDINKVVRVEASLTGASITGNCAVSGNVSASSLAVTGAITFSSINSTPIGATTPSTGAFTALSSSGIVDAGSYVALRKSGAIVGYVGSAADIMTGGGVGDMALTTSSITALTFGISNYEKMRISTGGKVLVGTTTDDGVNALQVNGTAKATSIKFANTGGTKQALDYYEEGTWTPVTSVAGGTYTAQVGTYTRIGRQVTVQCNISWSAHSGAGSQLIIAGLPFPAGSAATYIPGTVAVSTALPTGRNIVTSYILPSTSAVSVIARDSTATLSDSGVLIAATGNHTISYTYFI